MGKTHYSGLAIGDVASGIYSAPIEMQVTGLITNLDTGLPTDSFGRLNFPYDVWILQVATIDTSGLPVVSTVKIGTSLHGSGIWTGATVAGKGVDVWKAAGAGSPYVCITAITGTLPAKVVVTFVSQSTT